MRILTKPLLAALGALFLTTLSPQRSDACWLFHCCKKPRYVVVPVPVPPPPPVHEYAAPVPIDSPCQEGYYAAVCEDGRWKKVEESEKVGCVRWELIGEECGKPVPIGEVQKLIYPMIYSFKEKYWRRAYVGEPIDGFLPLEYHSPRKPGPKGPPTKGG